MPPPQRRVAIIGGGIAGSLCGLVLRSRGFAPTIIDQGKRGLGGRLGGGKEPDSGAVFLRASDPGSQWAGVLEMLAREGLVTPWEGRFGLLGSRGGGFLPLEVAQGTQARRPTRSSTDACSLDPLPMRVAWTRAVVAA